jgi:hypothetical protein
MGCVKKGTGRVGEARPGAGSTQRRGENRHDFRRALRPRGAGTIGDAAPMSSLPATGLFAAVATEP